MFSKMVSRMENTEPKPNKAQKRKKEAEPRAAGNTIDSLIGTSPEKRVKKKKVKSAPPVLQNVGVQLETTLEVKDKMKNGKESIVADKDMCDRYPIFKNDELLQKFLRVPMNNNQKGRIRLTLKEQLKGASKFPLPDVIHNRIQSIMKKSDNNPSETELRKIRVLYNMLKTSLAIEKSIEDNSEKKNRKLKKKKDKADDTPDQSDGNVEVKDVNIDEGNVATTVEKTKSKVNTATENVSKVKGPKRYVVFVGNLPLDIDKDKIMQHFEEFNEYITDIRIPECPEGKKTRIAYVDLKNESSFELALSKHHSMLGKMRINVLYPRQKNGKVSETEAKGKSAKLIALQKAGMLIGSVPANKKRSHRRKKMKMAQAKLANENA